MARTPKADYRPLIEEATLRRLLAGDEVTIASVAAELGISPGLVHFYSGSRQEVLAAAWRSILDANVADDQGKVGVAAVADQWEQVAALIADVFAAHRDDLRRAHIGLVGESFRSELMAEVVSTHTYETVRSWRETLEAAQELGVISTPLDPEAVAMMIMALPLGISALGITMTPEQRDGVSEAWSAMLQSVLRPDYDVHTQLRKSEEPPPTS